jgi:hypothetical protein
LTADQLKSLLNGTAAGVNGRLKMTTHRTTQTVASVHIHLYLLPRVHPPGVKRSPARSRR